MTVSITNASAPDALVVPINALVALSGGGYAIETVDPAGVHQLIDVSVGLVDDTDNLIQVTRFRLDGRASGSWCPRHERPDRRAARARTRRRFQVLSRPTTRAGAHRSVLRRGQWRVRVGGGPIRVREDHLAAHHGQPRPAQLGHGADHRFRSVAVCRTVSWRCCGPPGSGSSSSSSSWPSTRTVLDNVADGLLYAGVAAQRDGGGRPKRWPRSAWLDRAAARARRSCRAGNASGWR